MRSEDFKKIKEEWAKVPDRAVAPAIRNLIVSLIERVEELEAMLLSASPKAFESVEGKHVKYVRDVQGVLKPLIPSFYFEYIPKVKDYMYPTGDVLAAPKLSDVNEEFPVIWIPLTQTDGDFPQRYVFIKPLHTRKVEDGPRI